MIRTNIHLTAPQLAALRRLAQQRDTAVSELVRQAVTAFLKRNPTNPDSTQEVSA